jgi:prepilin peptidase CpaA
MESASRNEKAMDLVVLQNVSLLGLLLIASLTDLSRGLIPNSVTFTGIIGALILHTAMNGSAGLQFWLMGIILGFMLLVPVYAMGGIGAGDVKLLMAVGGLVGPGNLMKIFIIASLIGGLWALALALRSWGFQQTVRRTWIWMKIWHGTGRILADAGQDQRNSILRYAPVLAVGTLLVQLWRSLI